MIIVLRELRLDKFLGIFKHLLQVNYLVFLDRAHSEAFSIPRSNFKVRVHRLSFLALIMVVRAVTFITRRSLALASFVVVWMIFLLFPTVTFKAAIFHHAIRVVYLAKLLLIPVRTLLFLILKYVRLSSEILPVVSVNTLFSVVFLIALGAPHSLEMEQIKVSIVFIPLKQIYR